MRHFICLMILFIIFPLAGINSSGFQARQISLELIKSIEYSKPIILEVRAGEFTNQLEGELSQILLSLGADIREPQTRYVHTIIDPSLDAAEDKYNLTGFGLESAHLVRISMDITWQMVEEKRFLSYRTSRVPVYSFDVKTIELPENRLKTISTYEIAGAASARNEYGSFRLRWFEPIFASAALGSLLYLLWTTE
ncbi:MAG: hypothetical protein U1C33_01245 [Candidatus Cloacimonadaceae bacterium]|nr:hypothetical protein [Candidatus Cloacimonadaceae bacterium]